MTKEGYKPTICVDFDGVIHSYTSGWWGETDIRDDPVDGALEWLESMLDAGFEVAIFSGRSCNEDGILAMQDWFSHHWELNLMNERWRELEFPDRKPAALLYIDDRGFQFRGEFPTAEYIRNFKPWNKP